MKDYKKKIYLFLYISLLIVIGSFAILFFNFRKQVKLQAENLNIERKLILADSLTNNLLQIESDKRGFQLTGDVGYLKNIYALKVNCNNIISTLKKNIVADANRKIIPLIDSLAQLRLANLDNGIIVFTTKGPAAAVKFMQQKDKKDIRELLAQNLSLFKNNLLKKFEENTSVINKKSNHNLTGLLILLLIFILLMLVAVRTFRQAQQKILKNHFKFKEAQRIAKMGSWEWDFAANNLTWSQEQFRIFGENRETFDKTFQSYLSHLTEKEQENTKALIKDVLEGKANYAVEHEIIRKDGTILVVFEQGNILLGKDNKPTGMIGTTQDITERVKREEKIRDERQLLRTLIDNIPDPIYIKDIAGRKTMANKVDMEFMGVGSETEFIGKTDIELFPNKGGIQGHKNDLNVMETGQPVIDKTEEFIDKNGVQRWLLTSKIPFYNDDGGLIGLIGIGRDITKRKVAEEALQSSEERYRKIVETSQEGIWVLDKNSYTVFVNKRMCEILEYPREEIMGKQNYDFKDEEGKIKAKLDIERRKSGITETLIAKFITKSGRVIWTNVSTNPIFDEDGNYAGALGMFTDITDRKKADEELVIAQKKYQAIFDNTVDGIYQSTIDGKFIMVNPSMARIFGYDSADEMVRSIADISSQIYVDPEERKKLSKIILQKGHIENFELQVFTKTKDIIWVSANIRIVRDENDAFSYLEGILEDISDRKRGEEQLLNMSNRLQLAVDATGIGIWDWDIANNITVWDDEMYSIYNVNTNYPGTVAEAWEKAVHPEDLERVNKELQAAIKGEKKYDTEFKIIWKDGTIHYVKGNALVQRNQSGEATRMIGTNADITERKEAEVEILQLNKNLDQFANITAHDLQEPIRMVSGFLGLLERRYNDILDEQGKAYVFRAKDGADRMSILIRDLLEFSRSGNKAAKKEPVDLAVVMDLVNKDLSIVVANTGARLNMPASLPVVTGTQSALYRLFLNLISNGIKFRKKDTAPEVTLTVIELPDFWEFTLQDNGIGVAEKDMPKLFQAFQRLNRREEYPGTGLGLVTCKKIVETHGGKIWMTSEIGKGTTFHFTINKIL